MRFVKKWELKEEYTMTKETYKVGDWIQYKGTYEGYLHIEDIKVINGVTYYYERSTHSFVDDTSFIKKVNENDERFKRYKLYLELKNEFNLI